nr:arginine-specific carbamoyl phosphate synthetase small subunit [Neurospora crassa]
MFSRLAARLPKASALNGVAARQVRNLSQPAITGSKGRNMPAREPRTTAAATGAEATFTIRDGPVFQGTAFGANTNISGEAVFTTSLVGYPESMTDPSYRGQILVFTQPLIGNYGVPSNERDEFNLLSTSSLPTSSAPVSLSPMSLPSTATGLLFRAWASGAPARAFPPLSGVDTRAIVTYLREQGSSLARISIGDEYDADEDEGFIDPGQINLVKRVSTKAPFVVTNPNAKFHVALIDCGVKENILRSLVSRGASVTVFPYNYPIHKVAENFDGVFISNGPGDPTHCQETVYNLAKLMETSPIPIMGICLGHQLLALAVGAKTIKLSMVIRAHNIPALDLTTGQCHITSQNHGYAVDISTLPSDFKEYFVNLNDGSNEGMMHKTRPIFSTQFHPEAKGGPMDSSYLFDKYMENVELFKSNSQVYRDNRPTQFMIDILSKERVGVEPTPLSNAA